MKMQTPNPEKLYAIISTGIALLAAVLIFLPGWTGMDGMNGGYALSFIAIWLAISAALVAWYFWGRAAQLERMLKGQELLAHWTYSHSEWQAYANVEEQEQIQENRGMWYFMAGMCILTGGVFYLIDREAGLVVLLVMLALTFLLAIVAFGLPRLRRNRQVGKTGETWFAPSAIWFDGVFYPVKSRLMWLDRVEWQEADGSRPASLHFYITHFVRTGIQSRILRIPVPVDRRDEAQSLLEKYNAKPHKTSRRA